MGTFFVLVLVVAVVGVAGYALTMAGRLEIAAASREDDSHAL